MTHPVTSIVKAVEFRRRASQRVPSADGPLYSSRGPCAVERLGVTPPPSTFLPDGHASGWMRSLNRTRSSDGTPLTTTLTNSQPLTPACPVVPVGPVGPVGPVTPLGPVWLQS